MGFVFTIFLDSSTSAYIHGIDPLSCDALPFDSFRFDLLIFCRAFLHHEDTGLWFSYDGFVWLWIQGNTSLIK